MENFHKLKILNIVPSSLGASSNILLLASEENPNFKFPIVIGHQEAQSISIFLEGIKPSRPLTHDLFQELFNQTQVAIHKILISGFLDGVFFAKIYLTENGNEVILDARPSDSIAIAIRMNAPIYISNELIKSVTISETSELDDFLDNELPTTIDVPISLEDLHIQLANALKDENYEQAAKIRDDISSLNK